MGLELLILQRSNHLLPTNSLVIEIPSDSIFTFRSPEVFAVTRNKGFTEYVTGSAQPQITIDSISKCKFNQPPENLVLEFTQTIRSNEEIVDHAERISHFGGDKGFFVARLISGKLVYE